MRRWLPFFPPSVSFLALLLHMVVIVFFGLSPLFTTPPFSLKYFFRPSKIRSKRPLPLFGGPFGAAKLLGHPTRARVFFFVPPGPPIQSALSFLWHDKSDRRGSLLRRVLLLLLSFRILSRHNKQRDVSSPCLCLVPLILCPGPPPPPLAFFLLKSQTFQCLIHNPGYYISVADWPPLSFFFLEMSHSLYTFHCFFLLSRWCDIMGSTVWTLLSLQSGLAGIAVFLARSPLPSHPLFFFLLGISPLAVPSPD